MNLQFWENNDLHTKQTLVKIVSNNMKEVKIAMRFHGFFMYRDLMAWTDLTH